MIQFVGSDIGGTLTNRKGEISLYSRHILDRLPVPFCLVTGFNRHVAFAYRDQFCSDNLYLIAQNGSFAYHGHNLLFSNLLQADLVPELVAFIMSFQGIARVFCTDNNVYCFVPDGYSHKILRWDDPIYKIFEGDVSTLPAPVIQVGVFEPIESIERMYEPAVSEFGDVCIEGSLLYGSHKWLEFNHPRAKKHIAFQRLLKELDIPLSDAMYCGDNYNDTDLLRLVGHPVVVGNAVPEVKALAGAITAPGYDDGIARYLNAHFNIMPDGTHEG